MAVRKKQQTAAVAGAVLASAPGPGLAPTAHARPPGAYYPEAMRGRWSQWPLRSGIALVTCFEVIYFFLDINFSTNSTPVLMVLHVTVTVLGPAVIAVTALEWFERYWRPTICFAAVSFFSLTTGISVLTGDLLPLFITIAMGLTGTAGLVPWTACWQATTSACALGSLATATVLAGARGSGTTYLWIGALLAAALAQIVVTMAEQYGPGWQSE